MFKRTLTITPVYVPASLAGSTGTIFTQSGVDITSYRGEVVFVLSATTSSTAGATDKVDVVVQHSTASAHGDASWANVTDGSFVRNVTGSTQFVTVNADTLNKYVRLKATATGTFAVGLAVLGSKS